ncbi:helix-turn-helix domain-containing protein [Aquisphaera insulae]|uniref:helix-turn-helix domain-containing protein n=1 Tax=Aquisphaera insulae TaxID=2712864 RepID=UPI0013E9C1E6|nr:helix-turn-helix domain-containing protein [Aquisphaera insulae]
MGTTVRTLPDSYFRLVRKFPLVRIRDAEHLARAQEILDDLLMRVLDEGGNAYLDALSDFIENYENEHEPAVDVPTEDVLRELVHASGLSQQRLAAEIGIAQSTISALLTGSRKPTAGHVARLARYFGVSPSVFLPAASPTTTRGRDRRR